MKWKGVPSLIIKDWCYSLFAIKKKTRKKYKIVNLKTGKCWIIENK